MITYPTYPCHTCQRPGYGEIKHLDWDFESRYFCQSHWFAESNKINKKLEADSAKTTPSTPMIQEKLW